MADYVTVANLALSKLGADDQLRDPDDDSHNARSVRAVWEPVRRLVLRKGKFNFSLSRAELTALDPSSPGYMTPYPWSNRFPVPADFLRLVEVVEPWSSRPLYVFERKSILADTAGPVFIRYVADVEEPGEWDALFVEAFASRLAYQIASRITGGLDHKEACWRNWRSAITEASGTDAKEDPPTVADEDDWILARYQ